MRKYRTIKGKKHALKNEGKFMIRKLSMTDRLRIKSSKSRGQVLKSLRSKQSI